MSRDPWPWPADTQLERARRVALGYREALLTAAPALAARLDARAAEWGQPWIAAAPVAYEADDLLTVQEAAEFCQVKIRTITAWRLEREPPLPSIRTPDGVRIRFAALIDWQADRRRARAKV